MKPQLKQASQLCSRRYDVIVIGSGLGGLTAAGLLARAGKKVLVLEQHDRPGGYVHGFKRKNYIFDAAVHITSGCGPHGYQGGQLIYKTLVALGVEKQLEFIQVDPFCHVVFPGINVELPQTMQALVASLAQQYPEQEQSLQAFIALCIKVTEQAAVAEELIQSGELVQLRQQLSEMLRYRQLTLAEVLKQKISDPELRSILACFWPYLGLPPAKVSFLYWANMFVGYLEDGAYYCKGGFQKLADVMVEGLLKNGGDIVFKQSVNTIRIANHQVQGVSVKDGFHFDAPVVISNADMSTTINEWVGKSYFPKTYLDKLQKLVTSLSIFVVYIATDLDLSGFSAETFCYSGLDHDQVFETTLEGRIEWLSFTIPTLNDPDLAPAGQHLVTLTTLVPFDLLQPWSDHKLSFQDKMLQLAERYMPGLNDHLLWLESGSPQTMYRYTGNSEGAAYGWASTPNQVGPNRISQAAPVKGLYFAGHWTKPGGGVYGVCVSGMKAAQLILNRPGQQDFWDSLK